MTFNFNGSDIRTIRDEQGEPWFVAKDVCDVLGFAEAHDAIKYLDEDEQTRITNRGLTTSRNPNVSIINESGLYSLILRSRKPEAKRFKKWVTSEVLPAIRKTGMYYNPAVISSSDLRRIADELDKKDVELKEVKGALVAAKPLVDLAAKRTYNWQRWGAQDAAKIVGPGMFQCVDILKAHGLIIIMKAAR